MHLLKIYNEIKLKTNAVFPAVTVTDHYNFSLSKDGKNGENISSQTYEEII
jgi:hypothetical protein